MQEKQLHASFGTLISDVDIDGCRYNNIIMLVYNNINFYDSISPKVIRECTCLSMATGL